ncbi:MAG: CHAD domain-containing protein [Betaproteobacteria bacterium]|nr:CHAD domain-containing protein [Betaproteobacteria bacterium]
MTARDALREACRACLGALRANRAGLIAGKDDEPLHRIRVALRRLRAAFAAFSPLLPRRAARAQVARIRWLLRELGPARDWDVFCASTLGRATGRGPKPLGLPALRRAAARLREPARARARRAVTSSRYRKLSQDLDGWLAGEAGVTGLSAAQRRALSEPLLPSVLAALERRWRRLRKRGRGVGGLDARALHRLRIAVKRFRYTTLFFAPLFPAESTGATLHAAEALQDALGGLNDCANAGPLLKQVVAAARGEAARTARAPIVERIAKARGEYRRALKPAWKALRSAERFWRARPGAG